MSENILYIVVVLLALSVAVVIWLRRLNLPPILGYLFVGIAVGPHAVGLLDEGPGIHLLAEIGVVFLLFSIGLEFSLAQLKSMKNAVLGLGLTQVGLTSMAGMAVAHAMGIPWQGAFIIGGAIALSSTAIVTKQLTEQLEMQSRHGRLALGALLFQDLAVVPFLVALPILANDTMEGLGVELLFALLKGTAALIIMSALGRWALRPIFHIVASTHSAEIFTLTVLLVALTAGAITHMLGLSPAMGAFLAGIMLGETEYRHQIETDIRPFRDVLMGLFFITIGMQLDITMLGAVWGDALILFMVLVLGKGLLVVMITRIMGYEPAIAVRTALVLAQGGEFGFAILTLALSSALLSTEQSQAILVAIIVSMMLAPILIRENGSIAKSLFTQSYVKRRKIRTKNIFHASRELREHVIIIGFGRIGQNLADFLKQEGLAYVALDLDPVLVKEAYEAGERVYYGDAVHISMLRAAGLMRASALVITSSDAHTAERIIATARMRNRELPILVRTQDDLHFEDLESAGATHVIPEHIESSMSLATCLMSLLGIADEEIKYVVDRARQNHYFNVRGYFHGVEAEPVEALSDDHYRRHTVVLPGGCPNIGRPIGELRLDDAGVFVIAVHRGQVTGENPEPGFILREGDAIIIQGNAESLERAEEILLG